MFKITYTGIAVAAGACLLSCAPAPTPAPLPPPVRATPPAPPRPPAPAPLSSLTATAILYDLAGTRVGDATIVDTYSGVLIRGSVIGLGLGAHAMHIHAVGKCEPPAFASAGGHYNPDHKQHGYLNINGPHAGDLPNLETPPAGELRFEVLVPGVRLTGTHSLLSGDGTSIVIHSGRDDLMTDPSGNSGSRVACGVITAR